MKLFVKYNRINLSATITVFLIGSFAFYFMLRYILINQLDHSLESEHQEALAYLSNHGTLPEIENTKNEYTTYTKVNAPQRLTFRSVSISVYNKREWVRNISFTTKVGGDYYLVSVNILLEETEDLLQAIIGISIGMIALILLITLLINRQIISRMWQPFYQSIEKVKNYNLASQQPIDLPVPKVDEFYLLNQSIRNMTERIQKDYQSLKDFTGYAAHEMQTPLSVIRTKLDLLMQNESFLQQSPQYITDIENAIIKLSRLYQSLLLLTKVENKQFVLNEKIDLKEIVDERCAQNADLAAARNIKLSVDTISYPIVFHHQLAEIIVNNLLNNALRYNNTGGVIDVSLRTGRLTVANTSAIPPLDSDQLFTRFYRHSDTKADGNGLGLSIIKQICDWAQYPVSYSYSAGVHCFTIQFYHTAAAQINSSQA